MERVRLTLADLKARKACLGCGAEAAAAGDPVLAAGVDLDALEDYLLGWPLCEGCRALERETLRRARWVQIALGFLPPAAGLAIAALVPFALPLTPIVGALLGVVAGAFAMRACRLTLARRLPVVVTAARGTRLEILRQPRDAPHAGPYRAASNAERAPSVAIGGGGWSLLSGAVIVGGIAWLSTSHLYPRVRFDNGGGADMTIVVDGGHTIRVPAYDAVVTRVRHGAHTLRVRYADEVTDGERVEVELPAGEPHLFAVDGEACFILSRSSESRAHRWSSLAAVTSTTRRACGRWIAIGASDVARAPLE